VAQGGAQLKLRDDAAPGPLTQASALKAPGRLARSNAAGSWLGSLGGQGVGEVGNNVVGIFDAH
jgi:hypothetical protein